MPAIKSPALVIAVLCGALLFLGSDFAAGQQSISIAEKMASSEVVNLVQQTRRQNGLQEWKRIDDPHLRTEACQRAKQGDKTAGIHDAAILPGKSA
jgi:hypothetical protein